MTTRELANIVSLADRLLAAGEPALLATLFSSCGSTYRPLGSMMVAGPPGMIAGGVSGGCLEEYIARHGREIVASSPAAIMSFDADPDRADFSKPTLGCGGSIEVLVERLTTEHAEFVRKFASAHEADDASAAACVIDTAIPDQIAIRRSWLDDPPAIANADAPLHRLHQRSLSGGMSVHGRLGPTTRALIQYIAPRRRLVVFGAGDDVQPLCTLAKSLDWHVTIADRRARLATVSRFGDADRIIAAPWDRAIADIRFTPLTAAVLMTHSLPDDIDIVPLLARLPLAYAGALGPAHRRQWVLEGARRIADIDAAFIERFRGPIGLNLGDRSAAGIAVAIMAEIVAEMNGRVAQPLSASSLHGDVHREIAHVE